MRFLIDSDVWERVQDLELPFNRYGYDPYGISQEHVAVAFTLLDWFYDHYMTVRVFGAEHVPPRGRAMCVGNHSGGIPVDGAIALGSLMFELDPPRLGHAMADKFVNRWPILSQWFARVGQFTGLPEHAERLLKDDRVLVVFPEGTRGTAKLFPQRHSLVRFGTGFMRLALKTSTPIIPFGFVGGGDACPTVHNSRSLGRLMGAPYVPVTPYLLPIPRPTHVELYYGEPIHFDGTGDEEDEVIFGYVDRVKEQIARLIDMGVERRRRKKLDTPVTFRKLDSESDEEAA